MNKGEIEKRGIGEEEINLKEMTGDKIEIIGMKIENIKIVVMGSKRVKKKPNTWTNKLGNNQIIKKFTNFAKWKKSKVIF